MTKQHKWHKEIKAWADGANIEYSSNGTRWHSVMPAPDWHEEEGEFRVAPIPNFPDTSLKLQDLIDAYSEGNSWDDGYFKVANKAIKQFCID